MNKVFKISILSKPVLWLAVLLMFTGGQLFGQLTVSIGEQLRCENSEVLLPFNVSDFNDVAAFTFYIQIDTLKVEFIDVVNPNVQLAGGGIISNFIAAGSYFIITWQSMSGVSIGNGQLFDLKMNYHEGNSDLIFSDNCEIALTDLTIVENAVYEDGLLMPAIEITGQPEPDSVTEGQQAQFGISLQNYGQQEYRWQQYDGTAWSELGETAPYVGVFSNLLTIQNVTLALNNYAFRCKVLYDECLVLSDSARLTVSPLTVISVPVNTRPLLRVFPNPADEVLHYVVNSSVQNFNFQLLNLLDEVVVNEYSSRNEGNISLENVKPGIYFLHLTSKNFTNVSVKVVKK
jgi:hypothetical protein